jgi:peptidoglycan/LPS O-acetylase OafA/YrhL
MDTSPNEARFHHLDALRAAALLAGILLHAIMSYMPGYREANWPLSDPSTNAGLGVLYFVIHIFRMSVFFLIAGFFARLLHQRIGTRGLIKNRLRRIGLPLIAFYLLAMPLTVVAIVWGARQLGITGMANMRYPVPVVGPPVPWGHLWFLYLLLVICLLTLAIRSLAQRVDAAASLAGAIDRLLAWSLRLRIAPVLLAAPVAIALFQAPWWVQWQGIPSPLVGLVPNAPALLAYGMAFALGWFLHRRQDHLRALAADWVLYLAGALAGSAIALATIGLTPRLAVVELSGSARLVYSAAYTLAIWCWTFAGLGLATRYLQAPNARWRYLADASYWMYLVHLPVVMLLQAWMLRWPLHWSIKLVLLLTVTAVILLASYHVVVRSTFMGVFLNGRRYPRMARG